MTIHPTPQNQSKLSSLIRSYNSQILKNTSHIITSVSLTPMVHSIIKMISYTLKIKPYYMPQKVRILTPAVVLVNMTWNKFSEKEASEKYTLQFIKWQDKNSLSKQSKHKILDQSVILTPFSCKQKFSNH